MNNVICMVTKPMWVSFNYNPFLHDELTKWDTGSPQTRLQVQSAFFDCYLIPN